MSLDWIDVTDLSFNTLLLLEREQLAWLPGWLPEVELATALKANPVVEWYLRNKNPDLIPWVKSIRPQAKPQPTTEEVRACEVAILESLNDLICYAVDPSIYDNLPFLGWDSGELTKLVDFKGKTVVDIGAGTGRLAFTAAEKDAEVVFAVELVSNLRLFLKEKAKNKGLNNLYTMDGLITDLPFPNNFVDIVVCGHVFGDNPKDEFEEMLRVVKPDGMIVLCPGNKDQNDDRHQYLIERGFQWSRFEEPGDGYKRKYWMVVGS